MGSYWNRSGTVERYADDLRASGALAYFYEGGTTTPLTVYHDSGQTSAHTNPVVADASGRWPDIFVPFIDSYDVRTTSAAGTQLTYSVEIPNPDPVAAPPPDVLPEQLIHTGMLHPEIINTSKAGFVRCNGKTIGNPDSGGTERADTDTADLYTYLWNNLLDVVCPVGGGRGATAALDFAANKPIGLPDLRGAALIGLDNMGNTAAGAFGALTFLTGGPTVPGSSIGSNFIAIEQENLPAVGATGTTDPEAAHVHTGTTGFESAPHSHSGTTDAEAAHNHPFSGTTGDANADHSHIYQLTGVNNQGGVASGGGLAVNSGAGATSTAGQSNTHQHPFTGSTGSGSSHTHTYTSGNESANHNHAFNSDSGTPHAHTFTTDPLGSGTPLNNLGNSALVTWYIKL